MWLLAACSSPPHPAELPAPIEPAVQSPLGVTREWVQVSAYPCALDRAGVVECWHGSDGINGVEPIPSNPEPVTQFTNHIWAQFWGVGLDGLPLVWQCGFGEGFATCQVPELEFKEIGSGCALDFHGQLHEWDDGPHHQPFPDEFQTHFAAQGDACVILNRDRVARAYGGPLVLLPELQFDPGRAYVEIAPYGSSVCALDVDGGIECLGPPLRNFFEDPLVFDNPPYVDIAGESFALCAKRADHVIECHDGSTYDFGPIKDFAVDMMATFEDSGEIGLQPILNEIPVWPGRAFSLCVITERNAIECVGPRFTPDLYDRLPVGQ